MLAPMRLLLKILVLGLVVFFLIQLVPYGRAHDNPVTVQEPKWDSPTTRALAQRGCFDCHSNLTAWPWYTSVAPMSWLSTRDVNDGRNALNFSEWQQPQNADLKDVIDSIGSNDMPPRQYRLLHKAAGLSDTERQQLERGLTATWTKDPPGR
jgi:heme-binding protein